MIAGPGAGAAEIGGDDRTELQEPAAQVLVGYVQARLGEHLLDELQQHVALHVVRPASRKSRMMHGC